MHDLLFERQAALKPDIIPTWCEKLGLDLEKLGQEIAQGAVEGRIQQDRQSGIRSGVNGTPTFFVNGARYDGAPDFGSLTSLLESELAGSP